MIGTTIGPYQILAKLGAGGMGEVYRARDTSLGRDVAIKVLPSSVANDPERLARFDREAKVLASLSHTNIAQIYGLERPSGGSGQTALVMELAAGQDLTVHLARGAMSLHDALPIATQIAHALEAAHERAIVHRDLKPANIKVTDDGAVKVLDFGLAKALDPAAASGSVDAMNSPTLTAQATAAGIILGTAAYMSPEQARGREADKRADVWAFGVVFFEMLTGRRLFDGETISDTLAAVLRQDIPWSALPAGTPPEISRLLRRCLERDRKNRLHDIADARIVLEEVARGGGKEESVATPVSAPTTRAWWPLVAAALVIGALAFAAGKWSSPAPVVESTSSTVRLVIPMPPDITYVSSPSVSGDGKLIAFIGEVGWQSRRIFVHRIDETTPRALERTGSAALPTLSHDGKWVIYQRANRLEKIAIDGGEPIGLADLGRTGGPGMTAMPDGSVVLSQSWLSPLSIVPAEGGKPRAISALDAARGEIGHWFPTALPDGRHVLFTVWSKLTGINDAEIAVLDIETGKHTVLFKGAEGRYVAPGFLVFYRAGAFHAIRFDPATRQTSGDAVRVLDDAAGNLPEGDEPQASLSASGTFVYQSGPYNLPRELGWISEGGKFEPLGFPVRTYGPPDLTADGRRIAVAALEGGRWGLHVLEPERRSDEPLDLPGSSWRPVWHPNGKRLAFVTMRKGEFDVYQVDLASSAAATPVVATDADDSPLAFLPDESALLVQQSQGDGKYVLKKFLLSSPEKSTALSGYSVSQAAVSRDGAFVAFSSGRLGRPEIYVQSTTGEGLPEKISNGGGTVAAFVPNKRELLYLREPEIVAVGYTVENGKFRIGAERVWARVEGSYDDGALRVGPDGRALVLIDRKNTRREIRVIVNWQHELAAKFR